MRGTVAKRIRQGIYGDLSLRIPRRYQVTEYRRMWGMKEITMKTLSNVPNSLRAKYQQAKKRWMEKTRAEKGKSC